MSEVVLLALLVTLAAGLCTSIGSAIAFFAKTTNRVFLTIALGFSAGVMIYVSFVEIVPKALARLVAAEGPSTGYLYMTIGFFVGVLAMAVIDRLIPSFGNPHEPMRVELMDSTVARSQYLQKGAMSRMGVFMALAVAIHNFPEGLATFLVILEDPSVGIALAIAIAIHNVPEGIAVSVPIYYDTGRRGKAFLLSSLSGLAEPVGALAGYLLLRPYLTDTWLGVIFAAVAGVMVFISLDELLPAAREYGRPHLAIYGMFGGMAVMALSLVLFTI
jgi:ZIP family zinc transporter